MIYIISYWFFIWYLLFILYIIPYNPLYFLIIGFIMSNIYAYYYFSIHKINSYNLTKYIILNTFLKFIPILFLIIYYPLSTIYDICFGLLIFIIYLIIMYILQINIYYQYQKLYNSYTNQNIFNNDRSILSKLYDFYYFRYFIRSRL